MMKKEQKLTEYEQFCKLNDKYLTYKTPEVSNSSFAIGLNAIKDKAEEVGFSKEFLKEIDDKASEISQKVKKELEEVNKILEAWLFNLIQRMYIFKNVEKTEEQIKYDAEKIRKFCNDTGAGLNVEFIWTTLNEFFI